MSDHRHEPGEAQHQTPSHVLIRTTKQRTTSDERDKHGLGKRHKPVAARVGVGGVCRRLGAGRGCRVIASRAFLAPLAKQLQLPFAKRGNCFAAARVADGHGRERRGSGGLMARPGFGSGGGGGGGGGGGRLSGLSRRRIVTQFLRLGFNLSFLPTAAKRIFDDAPGLQHGQDLVMEPSACVRACSAGNFDDT